MEEVVREEALDSESAQRLLQAFVDEIARLYPGWTAMSGPSAEPVDFEPPQGRFIVLYSGDEPVGCGGVKPLGSGAAEIKRLYVTPGMRRQGLGRRMIRELEDVARAQGYAVVRLDTGAEQPDAVRLFKSAGYKEIGDYNGNPFASHWFEKTLP